MKKNLILLVLAATMATLAPAVCAAGGPGTNQPSTAPFALAGRIVGIDNLTKTVSVQVLSGNLLLKPYLGQNVTLTITPATRLLLKTTVAATPISFADLRVGQSISADGNLANQVWISTRLTVGANLIHR